MPSHLRTSYSSNSSRKPIQSRSLRLPQSVYGTMLRTGVSTPSDFARAAQLTDDGGRLVMLQIAETYEGLARRAAGPADGSAKD
jgi:hypothetical protein